jgi:hypothetical protein
VYRALVLLDRTASRLLLPAALETKLSDFVIKFASGRRRRPCNNPSMRRWIALWFVLVAFVPLALSSIKNVIGSTGLPHNTGHIFVFAASGLMLQKTSP